MQIFQKKSPIARLERNLADGRARSDKLVGRLTEAQNDAEVHQREAVAAALNDDPAVLGQIEAKKRASEDRAHTLREALSQLDASIAEFERQLFEARDQAQRSETAEHLNKLATDFDSALPLIEGALAQLGEHAGRASIAVPEAQALQHFATSATDEISAAAKMIVTALRHQAQLVLDGSGPAALPAPAPEPVSAPPAPTKSLVLRFDSKWSIAPGLQRAVPAGFRVDLSLELAERALKAGVAFLDTDPRIGELIRLQGGSPYVTDESKCIDLDSPDVRPPEPVQRPLYRELSKQEKAAGQGWWRGPQGGAI